MYKKLILLLVFTIMTPIIVFSQSVAANPILSEILKDLRKETKEDHLSPSMTIDGSIPIYDENGKKLETMDMMIALQSGNSYPVRYINDKKEIKAYVLRPTSTEEKKQIKNSMNSVTENKKEMLSKPAKPFTIKDMKGKAYSLEDLKGKIVVINFWFVECKPCVMEMPELNKLVEKYKNKNVVFLAVSNSDKSKIKKFLKNHGFKYNIVPKDNENNMIGNYKINAYPTHIIIDKQSNISYYATGLQTNTVEVLDNAIETLTK